jgi:hypothetical protein
MSISKTIDTALVLKASVEETSGTDGAGTALDLGGAPGLITAIVTVTAVKGNPASKLDLVIEGSLDNVTFHPIAKVPQLSAPGQYLVPIFGGKATDVGALNQTTTPVFTWVGRMRYVRKNSTVTAGGGGGGDGVTYSIHLSA